jgi:hypothetical protein
MSIDFRTPEQIETAQLDRTIRVIIKNLCKKELGFIPFKFTYGRKEKGVYVYLKENSKPVFFGIEQMKPILRNKEKRQEFILNILSTSI